MVETRMCVYMCVRVIPVMRDTYRTMHWPHTEGHDHQIADRSEVTDRVMINPISNK
jgi:hypothetical protein